jgi:hypothetical protein
VVLLFPSLDFLIRKLVSDGIKTAGVGEVVLVELLWGVAQEADELVENVVGWLVTEHLEETGEFCEGWLEGRERAKGLVTDVLVGTGKEVCPDVEVKVL